jgi:predicted esterase
MLLIAGANDETGAAEAIQKTAEQLRQRGHQIEVQILDGVKHEWPADENNAMWEFLSGKRVPEDCANGVTGDSKRDD